MRLQSVLIILCNSGQFISSEVVRGKCGEEEVEHRLKPQDTELWGDIAKRRAHGVELDKGEGGRGGRKEVVCSMPRCGQELQGVGYTGKKDKSYGEKRDEHDGCFTVAEKSSKGLTKERGGEHKGAHQRHHIPRCGEVGQMKDAG